MGSLRSFTAGERGTAVLILLLLALTCVFGVLGFDFARAHAVHARLRTAADAAALAGAKQAEIVPEYEHRMYDESGNPTTDPEKAVEVRAEVAGYYADLQDPVVRARAQGAAREAFAANLRGVMAPALDVACPPVGAVPHPTGGYRFEADIDWSKPKYARDGSVYYDEFNVSRAEAGVRSYLLVRLFRTVGGEDVFRDLATAPRPQGWSGAIRLGVSGTAQALPGQM